MKAERLLHGLGAVDNTFIEEAAPTMEKKRRRAAWKWMPAAACLLLVVFACVHIGQGGWPGRGDRTVPLQNGDAICFVQSDEAAPAPSIADTGLQTRALTASETKRLFGDLSVEANGYFENAGGALVGLEGTVSNVKLIVSTGGRQLQDAVPVGDTKKSEVGGVPVWAGYFVTKANSKGIRTAIYYAYFTMDGSTVYLENAAEASAGEEAERELVSALQKLMQNGALDLGQVSE